jgi:hypothetical protein
MIIQKNIRAIKVKPTNPENDWQNYCNDLIEYLNIYCTSNGFYSYKLKEINHNYLIIRNDVEKDFDQVNYINNFL